MSTEVDEHGVYHIDGPPYAGFAISNLNGQRVEVIYKLFRYCGSRSECEEAYNRLMNLVISELQDLDQIDLVERKKYCTMIIWWRRRVDYVQDPDDPGRWAFSCRFDTTPPINPEFWDRWETKEGSVHRNVKDIIG